MVSGTLFTYPGSFQANKALIAAAYAGSDVKVDANFEFGKTNKSSEFLKKFPLGKVPAFEDSNGLCLNEANAIAQHVANEALLGGSSAADQAAVREYIEFADNEVLPSACTWAYPTLGFKQYNKQDTEKAIEKIKQCLTILNDCLLTKTFLVGERVTLADITLCCNLVVLYVQVLDPKFRQPYGNVNRWFTTCINQPNFKKVWGDIKLCEKMATFDNKRYQELHPKDQKKGKESKGKDSKPKETKNAEQKPKAAPAEEEPKPPPKKVDYFADVPKSDFVLDDWKKMYSNNKKEVYVPWLWEHFDKNAYSLWQCEYKYPTEYKVEFMASNLAGGFLQRIEGLRKHSFGILMTFPHGEHFTISGIWMFRGQKLAFELNPDNWNVDAEHFNFKKLDPENADDRKLYERAMEGFRVDDVECETFKEFK